MTIPDSARADECEATSSWLWITPTTPATAKAPVIDPRALAGLAYEETSLPAPQLTLRPPAAGQLVNVDTQLAFKRTAGQGLGYGPRDNAALGMHVATTVAVPAQLRVDAGTE